ncbi:hypothetical protein ONZ45_g15109 [Pleurotus djamor]|nr:hypothetical protein ONZ45_g15109 [Pleurotus djamor]
MYQGQVRAHLRANNVDRTCIEYLLKPDDKQDVKVAYQLLHAISILPPPTPTDDATSTNVRQALNTLGRLFFHLTMPYTCIDLSLKDQLVHLSAAAHILLALLREDNAGSLLMPIQLYTDIMIMVKNTYFCVAKTQVDNPKGKFWLVLLGTDRLEVLFGILQTMVGNNANLDVLQLVLRLTGTTEVSTILAKHPEWDRSPRWLQLPALSKENLEVHRGVDHINPASWRGDVHVADVVLDSCWTLGHDDATETKDWQWAFRRGSTYKVAGNLVEPINPQTTATTPGQPFYLFESPILITAGRLSSEHVEAGDLKKLPDVQPSPDFPYQDENLQACFACKDPKKEEELLKLQNCPHCGPPHPMPTVGLSVLDHMAAHILFDKDVKAMTEPCRLCLQPRGRCLIYLKKGKGAQMSDQVDRDISTCPNLVTFSYGPASVSSAQHPSSNVPMRCPDCSTKGKLVPAVWKYNMRQHYKDQYGWVDIDRLKGAWEIDASEEANLKELWKKRLD